MFRIEVLNSPMKSQEFDTVKEAIEYAHRFPESSIIAFWGAMPYSLRYLETFAQSSIKPKIKRRG